MNIKIISTEHLKGIIDYMIYLYDTHERSINEQYGLGFVIKKTESTYNVIFTWEGETRELSAATELQPAETEQKLYEDYFSIREDESISKLEQFVTDILGQVTETELTNK